MMVVGELYLYSVRNVMFVIVAGGLGVRIFCYCCFLIFMV